MITAVSFLAGLIAGLIAGSALEAFAWRERGDHEYLNRKESAGRLYVIERDEHGHPRMTPVDHWRKER